MKHIILVAGFMRSGKSTFSIVGDEVVNNLRLAFTDPLKGITLDIFRTFGYDVPNLVQMEVYKENKTIMHSRAEIGLFAAAAAMAMAAFLALTGIEKLYLVFFIMFVALSFYHYCNDALTVRSALIAVGASLRKHIHSDVFINILRDKIANMDAPVAVVQDCRFVHEVDMFHKTFGNNPEYMLHLVRIRRYNNGIEVISDIKDPSENPDAVFARAHDLSIDIYTIDNDSDLEAFVLKCKKTWRDIIKSE